MRMFGLVLALMMAAAPSRAEEVYTFPEDPEAADFIANEVIATFYHELGHALIDQLQLPVLGKEEDAADHLSVILMNDIWEEQAAAEILTSDATSYALMAMMREAGGEELLYWDVHSLDLQRYYTVVCLFYGANPPAREQLALDLALPPERAEGCEEEYAQAAESWYAVLDGTEPGPDTYGLEMAEGQEVMPLADLLAEEVAAINDAFGLPDVVTVVVADCGEANAYYDPADQTITLCNEYAENLQAMWEANSGG